MRNLLLASVLSTLIFIPAAAYAGSSSEINEKILAAGEELAMDIQGDQYAYIVIEYENKSDIPAVVWFTHFKEGKALPENELGPLFIRTKKMKNNGDQERIVLTSKNTDQIVIHVENGTVIARAYQNNKR